MAAVANRLPDTELTRSAQGLSRRAFWLVTVDSATNGEEQALAASGVPRVGTLHPENAFYYCTSVTAASVDENKLLYRVSAEYATRARTRPVDPSSNPFTEAPSWSWHKLAGKRFFNSDTNGSPYRTSSGEQMDPKEREIGGLALRYSHNKPDAGPGGNPIANYIGTINSSAFLGWPLYCVLLNDFSADLIYSSSGILFYRLNYEFHFKNIEAINIATGTSPGVFLYNAGGWEADGFRLDANFYDKDGKRLKDSNGENTIQPRNLNGYGVEIPRVVFPAVPAIPVYRQFQDYYTSNFNDLEIVLA